MFLREWKQFRAWLDDQTPGRRLWLMLAAVGVVLGALSLAGTPDGSRSPVVAEASDTEALSIEQATATGEGIGSLSERPGVAGRPVKTIAVARVERPAVPPSAAAVPAAAGHGAAGKHPATKEQRAEAPQPAEAPSGAKGSISADGPTIAAPSLKTAETKMNIQDVTSPGGISAWLVEEHGVPLLALRFVFDGGSSQDPAGKEGLANFLTAMMDEGAGELTATQYQERMEELAVRMGFKDAKDALYGSFETLTVNREPALEMLRLAINSPRFDKDAVERIRKQLLANLAYAAKNPQQVAGQAWYEDAFPNHPYGRHANGSPESIEAIQPADLEAYRKRTFARDTLKVVAVGDIDAKTLGEVLDKVFGALPAKSQLTPVPDTTPMPVEKLKVVEMDVPQSVVQFGLAGFARKDPDFIPAFVMNQILGGGGFASRLTEEVREKRGLAYSVYSYMQPLEHASVFGGGVATKNEAVKQSIDVIRSELERMAKDGPTETELANAKSYLTGSFALRFDTNAKIANQLLWMMHEHMGIDYPERRNAMIEAVSMEDVRRAAKRLLKVDDLFITVVGKPKGLGNG
jgi:zinc protease